MATTLDVFISSKMLELRPERDALFEFVDTLDYGDIHLHAWVFEKDAPATSQPTRDVYLNALRNSALYIGLLWNEFGEWTVDELERATEWGIERHVYVKDVDPDQRSYRVQALLEKYQPVTTGITTKWFKDLDELKAAVRQSIETWVDNRLRARAVGPAATVATDPGDLVELPRHLVGRATTVSEVTELLARLEPVLLHGLGGIGKTALAAAIAGEWLTSSQRPVIWLKAGSAGQDALFQGLARPFDAHQRLAGLTSEDAASTLRDVLRDSGAGLVVLDDCWNGRALFATLKALPRDLPALITSRQRYAIDRIVDVDQLSEHDASDLLLFHANRDQDQDAAALCRLLAHHPFALEIAGKTMSVRRWTAAELLSHIAERPHELALPGDFAESGRASVTDLLDATVQVLEPDVRDLFFAFGAFSTPQVSDWMLAQFNYAEIVWADDQLSCPLVVPEQSGPDQVRAAVQTLELHGLVRRLSVTARRIQRVAFLPGEDTGTTTEITEQVERYRVHDLAHAYARSRTSDEGHKKALDVCLAYTFFYAEPDPDTYQALRSELDNLLGAARFAFDRGHYHHVERFVSMLYFESRFLQVEGTELETIGLLSAAVTAARKRGDVTAQYLQLINLGNAYRQMGHLECALSVFNEALGMARREKDAEAEQQLLTNIGATYLSAGDPYTAAEHLEQGLKIARRRRDRIREGHVLSNLGYAHALVGNHDKAYAFYKKALTIARKAEDDNSAAITLANLARLFYELKSYGNAEDAGAESIDLFSRLGDRPQEASVWRDMGLVCRDAGSLEAAADAWGNARDLYLATGNAPMVEECDRLIAGLEPSDTKT